MRITALLLCLSLLALTGCGSLPLVRPFTSIRPDYATVPEATLREVALEIEQAVKEGRGDVVIADREGVLVSTKEIQQAIQTRAKRSPLFQEFLNSGHVFEMRNGTASILRTKEYKNFGTSSDRDRNALLIMSENSNRWTIYEGIVNANNYPARSLSAVQAIFFEARQQLMNPGQKYENEDGKPVAK